MKQIGRILLVVLIVVLLGACNKDLPNSVQLGVINSQGNVELIKTLTNDKIYSRSIDLIEDARNIRLSDTATDHMSFMYIQFTNEKQRIVKDNYYLWDDEINERYICKPYFDSDNLYYEVTKQEYHILKRQLNQITASQEKLKKDKKVEEKEDEPEGETLSFGN